MKLATGSLVLFLLSALLMLDLHAQQKPIASPRDSVLLVMGSDSISVNYGRPSMRGRVIMGGLVPWDKVWRTGANQATHVKTNFPMIIGGVPVPKGAFYALDHPLTERVEDHRQQTDRAMGHQL